MAMQARKRSEEDILLARVLHRRGQAHARGRVKMVQSVARRTLGSKRSEGGACGGPPRRCRERPQAMAGPPHLKRCSLYLRPPKKKHMPAQEGAKQ